MYAIPKDKNGVELQVGDEIKGPKNAKFIITFFDRVRGRVHTPLFDICNDVIRQDFEKVFPPEEATNKSL